MLLALMPPKVVGPYQIVGTLGKGGVGTVYRAVDRRSAEEVALKLLSSGMTLEPTVARRMAREFEALAELAHPNVVRVFDAGVHQGYPYLVMELVEGLDLKRWLESDLVVPPPRARAAEDDEGDEGGDEELDEDEPPTGPRAPSLPRFGVDELFEEAATDEFVLPDEAAPGGGVAALHAYARTAAEPDTGELSDTFSMELPFAAAGAPPPPPVARPAPSASLLGALNRPERVGRLKDAALQICEALSYIHAHGLVHRDLKPGNILVDEDRRVRLMDFGLAKHLAEETGVTQSGRVVGTYRYMAPEQAMGERVDGRADLYSLGVILYELLTGRPPYDGETPVQLWQRILESEPEPISHLNPDADEQLVRVAHRLLRKDPYERFQTAEEVFELLIAG